MLQGKYAIFPIHLETDIRYTTSINLIFSKENQNNNLKDI